MTDRDAAEDARARWNARYRAGHGSPEPASFLTDRAPLLPSGGRALDVAGGAGRHALWLARRGLEVTLVDVSDVALERAEAAASGAGLDLVTVRTDLTPGALPTGPFAVVLVHHYLDRGVWATLPHLLGAGGVLLVCQPTVRNLERHPRPSATFLLDEGEGVRLATAWAETGGLEVVEAEEGWTDEDRHEAHLVLRRPWTGRPPEAAMTFSGPDAGRARVGANPRRP